MATPHISSLNSDAHEGVESCPALGTGLEFAELNVYTSNTAGKMGFFPFNSGLCRIALPPLTNTFGNGHGKGHFQILKNKTLFFLLSPQAKNKDKVNLPLAAF